jgi:hypothetical protein
MSIHTANDGRRFLRVPDARYGDACDGCVFMGLTDGNVYPCGAVGLDLPSCTNALDGEQPNRNGFWHYLEESAASTDELED